MGEVDKQREAELLAIQQVMSSQGGRDFMWRCLEHHGVFTDTFHPDKMMHAVRAGRRQAGLWLDQELREAAQGDYLTMIKEHFDE
jgi:hypothetical protein